MNCPIGQSPIKGRDSDRALSAHREVQSSGTRTDLPRLTNPVFLLWLDGTIGEA